MNLLVCTPGRLLQHLAEDELWGIASVLDVEFAPANSFAGGWAEVVVLRPSGLPLGGASFKDGLQGFAAAAASFHAAAAGSGGIGN